MYREKKVRIVSVDKRYRLEPYPAIPVFNHKLGTYMTGQHIDPSDPSTKNNLTYEEMVGKKPLSEEKAKRFPYIIVPEIFGANNESTEVRIPILNLRWFDLSTDENGAFVNPKDAAEFEFCKIQSFVAPNKQSVKRDTHYFYIEDLQVEAEQRISKRQLRYKAEKLVNENANISRYKDIALLLNYKIKDFSIQIDNVTETLIQDKILEACETNPQEVLSCFDPNVAEDIFILKAVNYGLVQHKDTSFYDGSEFLGDTLDEVKQYIRSEKGARYKLRWLRHIESREGINTPTVQKQDKKDMKSFIDEIAKAIAFDDFDKAKSLIAQAELIDAKNPDLILLSKKVEGQAKSNENPKQSENKLKGLKLTAAKLGIPKEQYEKITNVEELQNLIDEFQKAKE